MDHDLSARVGRPRRIWPEPAEVGYADPMDEAGLPALQSAILERCGCESTWVESVPVRDVHEGLVVWDGEVQVFDIAGHPKTTRVYAWSLESTGTRRRFQVMLGIPPVDDAFTAVRVAMLADSQPPRR
jgi:hypothetical protein